MDNFELFTKPIYKYCPICKNKAWLDKNHDNHKSSSAAFVIIEGVILEQNILSDKEESDLVELIDSGEWVASQEGREKQDFGPRVNFLQQKVSIGNFIGFPDFTMKLFDALQRSYSNELADFEPVELCFLEYTPERQSYIRPHYDDKWIWGDRLVTLNLLSKTTLRLTKEFNVPPYEVHIEMPAKSLLIIRGEARNFWHHSISRQDVTSRRVAITWREFGEEILNDSQHHDFVRKVIEISRKAIEKP